MAQKLADRASAIRESLATRTLTSRKQDLIFENGYCFSCSFSEQGVQIATLG